MSRFVDRYQRFMAFSVPKEFKAVYARSIDIADYYRRHFQSTPRTIFVSKTDHVMYDKWWLCHWSNDGILVPREKIPPTTRISTLMSHRREGRYFKDPLSYEFILVEDQSRSIRFERESPNPIWWFDYTLQQQNAGGSTITHMETPDVDVLASKWVRNDEGMSLDFRMVTEATFDDYAIAVWDLPPEFHGNLASVDTNAKEFVVARNCDGEYRIILFFDLKPDVELHLKLKC